MLEEIEQNPTFVLPSMPCHVPSHTRYRKLFRATGALLHGSNFDQGPYLGLGNLGGRLREARRMDKLRLSFAFHLAT